MARATVDLTLFFSDIEGSTALARELGIEWATVLATHNAIVRNVFARHQGVEARNQGDSFFAVFEQANDAIDAAIEVQRGLAGHVWPHGRAPRVRIGLHRGEAVALENDYAGLNVHLAARIMGSGHGGQVLASETVIAAAPDHQWTDLGLHILKDFPDPIALYQLGADGLDVRFPPLQTIDARDHNLPAMVTSFVGRDAELADLRTLLSGDARLVSLTGPGGVGKTRIATEAVWSVLSRYRGGAWFVDLAPVTDPDAILDTIADALGVQERPDAPRRQLVVERLNAAPSLLLLDNLEQLLSGVRVVSELLAACAGLVVLVTSREHLRLQGEHEVVLDGLDQRDAEALFAARAAVVQRGFTVDEQVEALCARLNGLPLAIELAAARLRTHTVDALVAGMDAMLDTLTEGERDRPPRHQTMRAAIAMSVDALTEAERVVFRSFAVFAGGATAEAVRAVCAPKADEVASLVDKSLLRCTDDRFTMLEPIRQFAHERLRVDVPGECDQRVQSHADYFVAWAESLEPDLVTRRQSQALNALQADHANLRLAWERGVDNAPLRVAAAMAKFWANRGFPHEGREVLAAVLAASPDGDAELRAKALLGAGQLALLQNDLDAARRDLTAVLALDAPRHAGFAHYHLGDAARRAGDPDTAESHFAAALALAGDDERVIGGARNGQGNLAVGRGDFAAAVDMFREAAQICDRTGDLQGSIRAIGNLGVALMYLGETEQATGAFETSLEQARQIGNRGAEAAALQNLAWATQQREGFLPAPAAMTAGMLRARDHLQAAIEIFEELGYRRELANALMAVPAVAADQDEGLWALLRAEGILRDLGDDHGVAQVAQRRQEFLEGCS